MHGETYLVTVAAIGLAFGGFTGFINAFRYTNQQWKPHEIAGMKLICQHGFAAAGFALIPFPLFYWLGSESTVWTLSSGGLAIFLTYIFVSHVNLLAKGVKPRRKWMLIWHFFPGTLGFSILQVCNIIFWHSIAAYSWGLLWLLNPPAVQLYLYICYFGEDSNERGTTSS